MEIEVKKRIFYFILVAIVFCLGIGIFFILNLTEKVSETIIEDTKRTFEIEGGYVVIYWKEPNSIEEVVSDFTEEYIRNFRGGKETYLIYSDGKGVYLLKYDVEPRGNVEIEEIFISIKTPSVHREILQMKDRKANIEINGKDYEFFLNFEDEIYYLSN